MSCKNFFFATVYVFWFLSLGISIAALFNSPEVDEDADKQVQTYHELTESEAWKVVLAWYMAIVVWGWLGFNEIRLILISIFAP